MEQLDLREPLGLRAYKEPLECRALREPLGREPLELQDYRAQLACREQLAHREQLVYRALLELLGLREPQACLVLRALGQLVCREQRAYRGPQELVLQVCKELRALVLLDYRVLLVQLAFLEPRD